MKETWKDISNYEGLYQVSNTGLVKALEKSHFNQFGAKITYKEKILKPIVDKYGYAIVSLSKNGKAKRYSVARLVGLHFLPTPESEKMVVSHINSKDKLNNSISNLVWNIINKSRANKKKDLVKITKNNTPIDLLLETVSGVYKIKNLINGKYYIGSSINVLNRLTTHFRELRANNHVNSKLQRSYNKYGEGNFIIEIIEICTVNDLLMREQFYLDSLKPELNLMSRATGGIDSHTEESKLKMSIAQKNVYRNLTEEQKESRRKNCSLGMKGKKLSFEQRVARSKAIKGSIKQQEHLKKLHKLYNVGKLNAKLISKPVLQFNKDMVFITEYSSIKEATLATGNGNIIGCCKGKRKTANGFIWKYKNEKL